MGLLSDTHCHLNLTSFQDDLAGTLDRAWEQGIERIMIPGIDIETSLFAVKLAEQHPNLFASVGVHPGDAQTWKEDSLAIIKDLTQHPKVVAIGEIGLDYYRDRSPRPIQREIFRTQLELAGETGLPVILHNRDAFEDLWEDLTAWIDELHRCGSSLVKHPGVLHSFDGSSNTGQKVIKKGFFIGISGPVTFKNTLEHQSTVSKLPLDHLMIETDAPFLTPHPHRGQRNEPAYVALVAEKLSRLHEVSLETVSRVTWQNAVQLFNWGANP